MPKRVKIHKIIAKAKLQFLDIEKVLFSCVSNHQAVFFANKRTEIVYFVFDAFEMPVQNTWEN